MKKILITLTLALVALSCGSKNDVIVLTGEFDPSYATYEVTLAEFVKGEAVDYRGLKEDRWSLDYFIDQLANLTPEQYKALDREDRMAVWINAYNGIVLRSIIDQYPVESINEIPGVWDSTLWTVAGRQVTLDDIIRIIRQDFKDPRVLFAINKGAVGSSPLANRPYRLTSVESKIDSVVRAFVNEFSHNRINPHSATLTVSEIFSEYGEDFLEKYGTDRFDSVSATEAATLNFVFTHIDTSVLDWIDPDAVWTVEYMPYDWSLNDVTR